MLRSWLAEQRKGRNLKAAGTNNYLRMLHGLFGLVVELGAISENPTHQIQLMQESNSERLTPIGYCFGSTTVIELARHGADIAGVVRSSMGGWILRLPRTARTSSARCPRGPARMPPTSSEAGGGRAGRIQAIVAANVSWRTLPSRRRSAPTDVGGFDLVKHRLPELVWQVFYKGETARAKALPAP